MEIPRWIRFFSNEDFRDYQLQAQVYRGKICHAMERDRNGYQLRAVNSFGEKSSKPAQSEYTSSCTEPHRVGNEQQPTLSKAHVDRGHEHQPKSHKDEGDEHLQTSHKNGRPASRTSSQMEWEPDRHSTTHKKGRMERQTTSYKEGKQERQPTLHKERAHQRHPTFHKNGGQERPLTTVTVSKGDKSSCQGLDHSSNETSGNSTLELINFKNARRNPVVLSCLLLLVVLIVGATVIVIYYILNQKQGLPQMSPEVKKLQGTPVIRANVRMKILNKPYKSAMNHSVSAEFASIAEPFSTELDEIFLLSAFGKIYYGATVQSLSPGSIQTDTDLILLDTGLVKDGEIIRRTISDSAKTVAYQDVTAFAIGDFIVCADCITVDLYNIILDALPSKPEYSTARGTTAGADVSVANTTPEKETSSQNPLSKTRNTHEPTAKTKPSGATPTTTTTSVTTHRPFSPTSTTDISATSSKPASSPSTAITTDASSPNAITTSVSTSSSAGTTTTARVVTTTATPSIHMSNTRTSLGADDATLTCAVRFVTAWNYLLVIHNTPSEAVPTITLYPNGSYTITKEDIKSSLNVTVDAKDEGVVLTLTFKKVACSDEGNYACTLFTSENTYAAHGQLEIVNIPSRPHLSLPVELIANRKIKEPITCVGNVGYPEGFLYLQMKSKSSPHFTTLPAHVTYDRRECHVTATAQLIGFSPTLEANGTVIRCMIENSRLLPRGHGVSTAAVMAVLPAPTSTADISATSSKPASSPSTAITTDASSPNAITTSVSTSSSAGTTTTARVVTTTATPSIHMSNTRTSLGADDATLTCAVRFVTAWNYLLVIHNTPSEAVPTITLYPNGSYTITKEDIKSSLNVTVDAKDEGVVLTLTFKKVACSDEGNYACTLFTSENTYAAHGQLEIVNIPTKPHLSLPVELIANRKIKEPITCVGNVGYPEGFLYLQMKSKSSPHFTTLPAHVTYDRRECHVTATAQLIGFSPTLEANGTVIRCMIENSRLLPRGHDVSTAAALAVLPDDICGLTVNGSLRHPYSCSKSIVCINSDPSVGQCPDELCFDPSSGQCGQVALSLRTSTGSLNEGLTAIACRLLHRGTWDILSVKRQTTSGYEYDIMHVHSNGSVAWIDSNLESRALSEVFISKYEAEILIWISTLKCADGGRYICGASGIPYLTQSQSTLSVISKPEEPILTVPVQVVENDLSQHEITCKAEVGYPAGRLVLKFRLKNETDFQRVDFDSTETTTRACRTQMEGKYVMTGNTTLNETLVMCEVESSLTRAKAVTDMLFIIPENYCGNENNTSLEHPFDCRYYIQCPGGGIYVSMCSVGLCFNPVNKQCDLPEPTEEKDDPSHPCYPNRHGEYLPHPFICNKYYWCVGGREEVQHCQQGTLYLGEGQCTFDVEESHCYNALNTTLPAV